MDLAPPARIAPVRGYQIWLADANGHVVWTPSAEPTLDIAERKAALWAGLPGMTVTLLEVHLPLARAVLPNAPLRGATTPRPFGARPEAPSGGLRPPCDGCGNPDAEAVA